MTPAEQSVIRAAWQTLRDMGLSLDVAAEFRTRLERQLAKWAEEDRNADPEWAA